MSSSPEGADPAPASSAPAESASQPSAVETSQVEKPRDEAPRRPAIRIGTQRYGVKPPPPAVPKPVLAAPSLVARPQGAPAPAPAEKPVAQHPPVESPTTKTPAGETPAAAPPQRRDRDVDDDESRAPVKPAAIPSISAPPRTGKVPVPNLRAELTADLEEEYAEALGGESLEDIIAGGTQSVVAEIEPESRHKARVVSVHRDNVFVEIGGRQQGAISLRNFAHPPEVGAMLDVVVSRFNAVEGLYELILPGGAVDVGDWSEVAEGLVVEARITGHNKGGLECDVNRLRAFIPASQVSMYRVEDLSQFVGQSFPCVITEANPDKRNLVLSRRAVLEREKAEAKDTLLASLEVGQTFEGTVRSLKNFGAFVDLGGIDGLIHISQLSWDRVKHADEVLQLGQKVKVKIQKIDPQTGKIGLAFRDLSENPWEHVARDFPVRSRVSGKVSRIMEFGAFVRLAPGVEGLIHISELSHKRVFRVTDVLAEGQDVEVQVQSVDVEQQRIGLSLKALEARAVPAEKQEAEPEPETPAPPPKKRKIPLRGGIGGPPSGDQFGLKW